MERLLIGIGVGVLATAAGYVAGALLGAGATALFSTNRHDRAQEIATTGACVSGPLGAVLALAAAELWYWLR